MAQLERKPSKASKRASLYFTLPILSWALYDFANTIFSSNINTIFFPFYIQEAIGDNEVLDQIASTFISYANAAASLLLVLFSPLYGVMIDRSGKKKKYMIPFTIIAVGATFMMGVFGNWDTGSTWGNLPVSLGLVIFFFIIAKFFYHSSLVFYDAMIGDIGKKEDLPLISGFGVAVGYIGTLVGLAVYPIVGKDGNEDAFIPTAILFLLFSLPLFFLYKDPETSQVKQNQTFFSGYKDIIQTFREMKSYHTIFTFMIAYFFLNDAISTTIAMMAVYAGTVVGFSSSAFILLYLVSTISSIIGSFIFGYITRAKGARKSIIYVSILLLVALATAVLAQDSIWFWAAGSMFGIALGSLWVTSRTFIVQLTPEEKRGQFFGLFAFSGKVSSIIGPFIYGSITLIFADLGTMASRLALGSLMILTLIGLIIMIRMKDEVQVQ
ncbi:MFS transporter [Peribacillus deserti]|uniref:MFS transporter n=1 Tax=Peribacillus deserti TaxID=673318 RepID=A0A2N5M7G3_9BACI|nr:MFS transporter [Peribacillus deserti]PLT30299.1 MFS transporter [Peribacillus deserti]